MFKNIKIGIRLGMGFGLLVLIMLALSWVNLSRLELMSAATVSTAAPSSGAAAKMSGR